MGKIKGTMRYIAHRGLFAGPDKELENNPSQISLALSMGYDVEVDLWIINSEELYLGHDRPHYLVDYEFISQNNLWIHAKNLDALIWLKTTKLNYFWHESDDFTLTSHKWIWTYPGKNLSKGSVMVMPEHIDPTLQHTKKVECYGICSDFIDQIRGIRNVL